jgi:hypothetical protein
MPFPCYILLPVLDYLGLKAKPQLYCYSSSCVYISQIDAAACEDVAKWLELCIRAHQSVRGDSPPSPPT